MVQIHGGFELQYLIVESAFTIKELEKLRVSFSAPEIEIADFEVTPDYAKIVGTQAYQLEEHSRETHSDNGYKSRRHHPIGTLGRYLSL